MRQPPSPEPQKQHDLKFEFDLWDLDGKTLPQVIEFIEGLIKEHGAETRFDVWSAANSDVYLKLPPRLETSEEAAKRYALEKADYDRWRERELARAKQTLRELGGQ